MTAARTSKRKRTAARPTWRAEDAASRYSVTRAAHAAETAEDYVEAIADLIEKTGEARVVELARAMGVSHVTVVKTISRLQKGSLVTTQPYRAIHLTASGRALARRSKRRHDIVVAFLRAMGVSAANALRDAEGIEHHVSEETLSAMERFARKHSDR